MLNVFALFILALSTISLGLNETEAQQYKIVDQIHDGGKEIYKNPTSVIAQRSFENDKSIGANIPNERPWYIEPDWYVAIGTVLLFLATTGLWIFTALMWCSTRRLAIDSGKQMRIALKSARAAEKAAVAAETQTAIIADQNDTIRKQHAVDRLQYLANHRPRVVVRQFELRDFTPGKKPTIIFGVFNVGDTAGYISEYNAEIVYLDGVGKVFGLPGYQKKKTVSAEMELKGGGTIYIEREEECEIDGHDFGLVETGDKIMHIIGYILYKDETGVNRRTGFFRGYDINLRRFRPIDDREYEYAD